MHSQSQLKIYKKKKQNLITTIIFIICLFTVLICMIPFSVSYYNIMYEAFGDRNKVLITMIPYVVFGIILIFVLVFECTDRNYTFRSFYSMRKLLKKQNLI